MADIQNISEPWAGHSGQEVETFLKGQISATIAGLAGKFGYVEFNSQNMSIVFYDQQGGTPLGTIQLSGDIYSINIASNLPQVFYVLADETTKMMTITPTTTKTQFGSQTPVSVTEAYTYTVAVNTGNGYVTRITGDIAENGSATFDLRPFLATGDNYIRVSVTGTTSNQTNTIVYTGTLTTLTMSVNHTWQNVWAQGSDYVLNGIRFSGNLVKTLHVALDGVELDPVTYAANQSYTTTSTTYTIPSSAFPTMAHNEVHTVTLWMTAQGVSTPVTSYKIMCAKTNDDTPVVAINAVTPSAVNYTSGTLFSYAVYKANKVSFDLSATLNSVIYPIASAVTVANVDEGVQYQFAYSLEVDTGANETRIGSLAISAKAYYDNTEGVTSTASTLFDNTYSYLATPGALFYMNAATRSNSEANYLTLVNEMGASQDGNFAASYSPTWTGLSWATDGWAEDGNQIRALVIPAGASMSVSTLAPLAHFNDYANGMTVELMMQSGSPSDYDNPVLTLSSGGQTPVGIIVYPTKIVVYGSNERNEVAQSVMLAENRMTHICVTFVKNYEGVQTRNLCSIYVNGTSNVNFAFDGASSFGNGGLAVGQSDTDTYIYKMRVYGMALEAQAVLNNFFNCIVDGLEFNRRENYDDNGVLDGSNVDYALVKAAGYNTMVVKMTDDNTYLPSIDHQAPDDGYPHCSMKFEYAGHPTWNVLVEEVNIDGQGTTSKKYFRWNLRAKTNSSTTWTYGDGQTATGKVGKIINDGSHIDIDRITAKKNYASSMQGHKMGMTGLYNDLFKEIGLGSHIPNSAYQVAVYQFPFVGFRYYESNDTYEYIGLYTAGPDKNSKETFGYNATTYPKLLSIEGPNHAPRGTRFLTPWVDVDYDYREETLTFGGEEGWDCDGIGGGLKSDKASDKAAVLQLYTDEWKPAYEIVFHCSPYIASLADALTASGYSDVADINAHITAFLGMATGGLSNSLLSFYDSNYDLWFYRGSTRRFENLTTVEGGSAHNILTYLGLTGSPSTADIIAARIAKFKALAGDYWDVDQLLFHYAYCEFLGVSDNDAKNMYPFKYRGFAEPLATGESAYCKRWGMRQDDLDTVLATDNNGRSTKPYYVEHGDLTQAGVEVFQGGNSALWVIIRDYYQTEIRATMQSLMTAYQSIASRNNITGNALHETVFNVISYYCWEHSAKYFAQTLYETDRRWSYIEPWLINPTAEYNNVHPLDQALGDQYQAERLWVERRIAYMFSKYRLGAFSGTDTNYGGIAMTLASPFTFRLTPAIELYPVASLAATDYQAGRTAPGVEASIYMTVDGQSNNYVHGADWLLSLGDLSGMRLTDRGGDTNISFSVQSARMQTLKVGDAVAGNVDFNATSLAVAGPCFTSVDARNTATVSNIVNLMNCPRLRSCLFAGSGATGLYLPIGARLTLVSFPNGASTVFMHSLPFLQAPGVTLPSLAGITTLYINNCAQLNPFSIVESILATTGETLQYITIIWRGTTTGQASTILELADKPGRVIYDGAISTENSLPYVEGTVQISGLYAGDLEQMDIVSEETYQTTLKKALSNLFGTQLYLIYDPNAIYIRFADPDVEAICVRDFSSDGIGVTTGDAAAVTNIHGSNRFANNNNINTFDELVYFTSVTEFPNSLFGYDNNLESISIPSSVRTIRVAFNNNYAMARVHITDLAAYLSITTYLQSPFANSNAATRGIYLNGTLIENLVVPAGVTAIPDRAFYKVNTLTSVTIPNGVTSVGVSAFAVASITSVSLPNSVTSIGQSAFEETPITSFTFPRSCTMLNYGITLGCPNLESIDISALTTRNGATSQLRLTDNCPNLSRLHIASVKQYIDVIMQKNNTNYYSNDRGFAQFNNNISHYVYINGVELKSFTYPSEYNVIYANTFYQWDRIQSVTIPSGVTIIAQNAFAYCKSLASITLPSTITTIQSSAFAYCESLASIVMPTNLTSLEGSLFNGCTALAYCEAQSSITSIGSYCFNTCYALKTFVVRATNPPTLQSTSFYNVPRATFKIYVPYSADHSILNAYKAATNWSALTSNLYELDSNGNIPT